MKLGFVSAILDQSNYEGLTAKTQQALDGAVRYLGGGETYGD